MKNGFFAIYKGKEYSADFIRGKGIVLRSYDVNDTLNGFQIYNGYNSAIQCILFVDRIDIQEIYELRTYAYYKGYKFEVMEETDDMISIASMGGDYKDWLNLGMKCIDKFVYQKWIKKSEAEIVVEREER